MVSAIAVLTMALGIGGATTAFSVADGVLFRPLPYANPDRLVMIWDRWTGWPATWLSEAEFLDYRERVRSLAVVGAWSDDQRNLTGGDQPQRVHVGIATAGVFQALGVAPLAGRVYADGEDHAGGPRVAVMSERLWRERYNADPGVIGATIMLDDSATTVIGIMPSSFHLPLDFAGDPIDLWVPLALGPVDRTARGGHYLNAVARLRAGVALAVADRDVQRTAAQMPVDYPRRYPPNFGAFTRSVPARCWGTSGRRCSW